MLCLTGLYLIVSVLATNLPLVTTALVADTNWSAVVSLPMRVVAYVVGLLAITLVETWSPSTPPDVESLPRSSVAPRYAQLDQEAEILSGSVGRQTTRRQADIRVPADMKRHYLGVDRM
jgi:hypothetical protein